MHTQRELTPQQRIDDFNQRLATLAHHQRKACALLLAEHLQQELATQHAPPKQRPPLFTRARRWLRQRWASSPVYPWDRQSEPSDTEAVVIIEATYTVVEPAPRHKETSTWAS